MKSEYLKTLWMLRFKKIKETEENAAWAYQEILDQCLAAFGPEDKAVKLLAVLVKEEKMHARYADELIKICYQTHSEVSSLDMDIS